MLWLPGLEPFQDGALAVRGALVVDDTPERYAVLESFLRRRFSVSMVRFAPRVPEDFGEAELVSLDYHLGEETALDQMRKVPPERLLGRVYLVHSTGGLEATMLEDWLRKRGLVVVRYPYSLMRMEVRGGKRRAAEPRAR